MIPSIRSGARAVAFTAAALALMPAAAQAAKRAALPGAQPDWATAQADTGAVPSGQAKTFWVYLKLRNQRDLDARVDAITDPDSPQYGEFLTPDQFRAQYAPRQADLQAVSDWLSAQGFQVSGQTPGNNRWVVARGSVARIEQAFDTQLRKYRLRGRVLAAPADSVTVPSTVAKVVAGVGGLDGSDRLVRPDATPGATNDAPPSPAFVNAPPCSAYWGEKQATDAPPAYGATRPYAPCGYVPDQLQSAYGLKEGYAQGTDGSGQTVAIVDAFASPTIAQDADTYARRHGEGPVSLTQDVPPGLFNVPENEPTGCDPQGWYGEETLDVEAVHATAPGAKILYAGGQDCNDESLIAAVNRVVDRGAANMVTNSYGSLGESESRALVKAWEDTFKQAAAEGIGMYFSSGDDGDDVAATNGVRTVDYPASDPLVTAVGGTSLGVGSTGQYLFETGWGTATTTLTDGAWAPDPPGDYLYGGGGGTSQRFNEPTWQKGVVPDSVARYYGRAGRAVPDVAMVGDPNTGMLVGQTQTFPDGSTSYSEYRLGGTSLSSPLLAGVMALVNQARGAPLGFANPQLYRAAGTPALRDVQDPSGPLAVVRNDYVNTVDASDGITTKLRTLDQTATLDTAPGYDDVTGVGSPAGAAFVTALASAGRR